jgi:hypothetical protein
MICPKCGLNQPEGGSECLRCGIIFARWSPRPASPGEPSRPRAPEAPPAPSDAPSTGSPLPLAAALLALVILGGLARIIFFPKGYPVSPGAFVDQAHGFSMSAPADWTGLTPQLFSEQSAAIAERLPPELQGLNVGQPPAAGFYLQEGAGEIAPSVSVVFLKGTPPRFAPQAAAARADSLAEKLKTLFPDYTPGVPAIVRLDKLDSLKLPGSATLKIKHREVVPEPPVFSENPEFVFPERKAPRMREVSVTERITLLHYWIPGVKGSYILTCACPSRRFVSLEAAFEGMADSFRVLDRPGCCGPVLTPLVKALLIIAIVYLASFAVFALLRRVFHL